ncbi:protein FAM177A1-like [Lineus longissimus]|uniref:protein FAM177A1-like n=1 Tax=Lineus longissimus TaxID=88925 RepID=UPI002B4D87C6
MASELSRAAFAQNILPPSDPIPGNISQVSPEDVYTTVPLEEAVSSDGKKRKIPRRILHFSDGTLEEYSTDEEEEEELPPLVDPKTLTWMPWFWYYFTAASFKALSYADFCGEKLAWFFGITTPKYQSAIDEFYRIKAEEEEERFEEELEKEAVRQRELQTISGMEGGDAAEPDTAAVPQVAVVKIDTEKY